MLSHLSFLSCVLLWLLFPLCNYAALLKTEEASSGPSEVSIRGEVKKVPNHIVSLSCSNLCSNTTTKKLIKFDLSRTCMFTFWKSVFSRSDKIHNKSFFSFCHPVSRSYCVQNSSFCIRHRKSVLFLALPPQVSRFYVVIGLNTMSLIL